MNVTKQVLKDIVNVTKQDFIDTVKDGLLFEKSDGKNKIQINSGEPGLIEVFIQKSINKKWNEIHCCDFTDINEAYNFIVDKL